MALAKSFTDLKMWQESHKFALEIYKYTAEFPKSETFGLTNQLRRACVSVTSNITEGFERKSKKEFKQFLVIARGSLGEIQSQLLLARDLNYINLNQFKKLAEQSVIIHKQINAFIRSLQTSSPANQITSKLVKTGGF